eukprot:15465371-Alexandrium_andersonii.AAC.1
MGQRSLGSALGHLSNCLRLSREGRARQKGPALGVVYDGLVRRQWSDWSIAGYRQFALGAAATS